MNHKAIILTWDGFQDQEVIYPYYRLQEEGFEVNIYSNKDTVTGIFGITFPSRPIGELIWDGGYESAYQPYHRYNLLVIPGGVKALEKLRQEQKVLNLIKSWDEDGKIISSTCHGAQMMISAKITSGREISGYYSIKDDINNSGATYVDAPAVVSRNIISSPHYKHMGEWMKVTIEQYNLWLKRKNGL